MDAAEFSCGEMVVGEGLDCNVRAVARERFDDEADATVKMPAGAIRELVGMAGISGRGSGDKRVCLRYNWLLVSNRVWV